MRVVCHRKETVENLKKGIRHNKYIKKGKGIMLLHRKNKILLMLGLLTLQNTSMTEQDAREIDLDGHVVISDEQEDLSRQPNATFNNVNIKGKLDVTGNMIEFAKAEFKERVDIKGVLDVKQNIDAGKNIICKGTVNAHHNVNAGHNIRATNDVTADKDLHVHHNAHIDNNLQVNHDGHIGNNLTVDGKLSAGNLVFTLSSTMVPEFSVCDLTVGCSLIIQPDAILSIAGNEIIGGTLSIGGDLSVSGNENINGNLSVGGNEQLIGTLSVGGDLSVAGNQSIGGDLTVGGMGSFGGTLIFGGDLSVSNNIDMLDSTSSSVGNINKSGSPFISNFGVDNTFVGANSGNFTMSGNNNTGIGAFALNVNTAGNGNTAVGSSALVSNGAGVENVAVGQQALNFNTSGSANTALGWQALFNNTTGTNNIAIGNGAAASIITTSNNIHIGNTGIAADSGVIKIGTNGTHNSAFVEGIFGVTVPASTAVVIGSNGQMGTIVSSARYKKDIEKIDRTWLLEKFARIIPVEFRYKNDTTGAKMFGMIAEELEKVMPELVIRDKDGNPETIAYHLFTPLLIAMIQQLQERVEKLEKAATT